MDAGGRPRVAGDELLVKEFGAFVECLPGQEGLVHVSELADHRVERVEDICKLGDEIIVKCVGIDDKGRVRLSRRAAIAENAPRLAALAQDRAPVTYAAKPETEAPVISFLTIENQSRLDQSLIEGKLLDLMGQPADTDKAE